MASNAQTLETSSVALGYQSLSNRNLLLCLVGYYASLTSLTAQNAVTQAQAAGCAALSDFQLTEALLAILS